MNILKPKNKKEKQIQLVIIVILSAIILYLIWIKLIKPRLDASNQTDTNSSSSVPTTGTSTLNCNDRTVLKKGSPCKEQIKQVQTLYNQNTTSPLVPLVVDGVFGSKTETAVEMFTGSKTTTLRGFESALNLISRYSIGA